ncbi:MAG: protein kinase [Myxococcales bacterium]|nr:protein kinase [Myxococcales bacterium]
MVGDRRSQGAGAAGPSGLEQTRAPGAVSGTDSTVGVRVAPPAAPGVADSTVAVRVSEVRVAAAPGVTDSTVAVRVSEVRGAAAPGVTDSTVAVRVSEGRPGEPRAGVTASADTVAAGRLTGSAMEETRLGGGRFGESAVARPRGWVHTGTLETQARSSVHFDERQEVVSAALEVVLASGHIGRFVVLRELGRGAMGVVFAAYDEELDRKVAIKLLHAVRGDDTSMGRAMLLREAQALARLSHPNVVAVHEVGTIEGAVFVAMEYVAGVDLQGWLGGAPRPWRDVVAMFRQAGEGLVAAHRQGLIHRDFKPSNVLVGEDGRVRVADFGLAARRGAEEAGAPRPRKATTLTATLTGEGALVGTPVYMAPELLRGGAATAGSDQYAFCVALYEALYGARPYDADTLERLTDTVETRPLPAAPLRPGVPGWLHAAVCRGLSKKPEGRFASLAELVELLGRDPEAERQQRRRRVLQIAGAIAGTAAIVALLVFGYGALRRYANERQAEGRLAVLFGQLAELRARGDVDEARRVLRTFVELAENRGTPVVARAYLEWAAAQTDDAAGVDAYASAYITARAPEDGHAALLGLIGRLSAQRQAKAAAAALAVLERTAPERARGPELQEVRMAAALARRDLAAAAAVGGAWGPVLADLSHVTGVREGVFRRVEEGFRTAEVADFGADLGPLLTTTDEGGTVRMYRPDLSFTAVRALTDAGARRVAVVPGLAPGEPLMLSSHPTAEPRLFELRLQAAGADGALRRIDAWPDSVVFHPQVADLDGDGRRELYVGTEAYVRKLWRIERAADGTWTRRSAHAPTDAVGSDLMGLVVADLEGDGRPELVAEVGPWKAYDVRVFKPDAAGELDQVARRSFGSFRGEMLVLKAKGRDLVGFTKTSAQVGPGRFPPDKPLGEPEGLYIVGLRDEAIVVEAFLPEEVQTLGPRYVGDLDGDGAEEIVARTRSGEAMVVLRVEPGQPLQPLVIEGLTPVLVHDLDGDGEAEIVAIQADDRVVVLGAGEGRLAPLPGEEIDPRPVPPGIADPVIAEAWTRAEQMVAIGVPRRTAEELSAIARLAGPVAPDMLLRTGELYAAIGEDTLAAEHYAAAATRADTIDAALAGAAAARRRRGEFAAAAELTRRRLAHADPQARADVEAELAALTAATAERPEVVLTFERPLDPRWTVVDPVAVRRGLERPVLSLWAESGPVLAEYPLVWDGGRAGLAVELDVDPLEWGAQFTFEVTGAGDQPWMAVTVGGYGVTDGATTRVSTSHDRQSDELAQPLVGRSVRAQVTVYPGFDTAIDELEMGGELTRRVTAASPESSAAPRPGPLRLRVRSSTIQAGFVGHLEVREIRLTGFTPGPPPAASDAAAALLAEGSFAEAQAGLGEVAGTPRQLWKIEALLGRGDVAGASAEMAALLRASAPDDRRVAALYHRLRRDDAVARLAGRAAFGPRWVEVLLQPEISLTLRDQDVADALVSLPAPVMPLPGDPEALRRAVTIEYVRGSALQHVGRLAEARAAYAAAFAGLEGRAFPGRDVLHARLLRVQLSAAAAMGDRAAAEAWVRTIVMGSPTPYLQLERVQSDREVTRLVGPGLWDELMADLRATRERPRRP